MIAVTWCLYLLLVFLLPIFTMSIIARVKAAFQNRIGPPWLQPYHSFLRLLKKQELISQDASACFDLAPVIVLSGSIMLAVYIPWLSFKPPVPGSDLLLVIYLFALKRFFSILASLDIGSPLSGFGASREALLAFLVEPAIMLSLISLALLEGSTDLNTVFGFNGNGRFEDVAIWALAAGALFVSSTVELSRMPVDDPGTHLELTMVHESMVIENSGRNLAFMEFAYALKMVVIYGLIVQCSLHAVESLIHLPSVVKAVLSIAGICFVAFLTALLESFYVKLKWRKVPGFIAYAVTLSLLCCFATILRGY